MADELLPTSDYVITAEVTSPTANMDSNWTVTGSTDVVPDVASSARSTANVIVETITMCLLWGMSMFGNTLVYIVIRKSRRLQSTTNYFVMSLACSDVMLAVCCMPFVLGQVLADEWIFGVAVCKIVRFLQILHPAVTTFVFVSICADRFYTILYPLSFKVTRCRAKQFVVCSWLLAAILAGPSFYFYDIECLGQRNYCRTYVKNTWGGISYVVFLTVVVYIVPTVVVSAGYFNICRYIWRTGCGGRAFQRTMNQIPRAKVKMVKMIMAVNIINVILTLPFFVAQLWHCSIGGAVVDPTIYIAVVWVYFSATVTRPCLYLCCNSNFRRGCKEVFCMSTMKCYRSNAYTITSATKFAKKNHIGIDDSSQGRDYRRMDSPSKTFDRSAMQDKCAWPTTSQSPSTYL